MTASRLQNQIQNKNVVFITVKNRDYIRVSQIERLLSEYALDYSIYSSDKTNPILRAMDIRYRIKSIDFSNVEIVIAGFLPQLIWRDIRKATRKYKIELISDFFLSLFDTVVLRNLLSRFLREMDKRVLNESSLVVTDTNADAVFFSNEFGVSRTKFETMYLEADPFYLDSIKSNRTDTIGSKTNYSILYFGTGLPLQGTDIVLEAFIKAASAYRQTSEHLICEGKDGQIYKIQFIFIGSTKNLSKGLLICIRKWLSQEELYKAVSDADLCIAGHFNSYIDKADRTIPGKAFIYEALKKKMVLGDTIANHELFDSDDRHFFVRRGSPEALAECIIQIISGQ